ncbi:MAG TPA: ATP-binding cassette domain-containing protein [Candidatus Acetothermia bacterium]|nr:ATP-binding cassette domain-containing protein [Candidatus Acetothermia bacterium]
MLGTYDIAIQVSELCFVTEEGVVVFEDLSFTLLRDEIKFVVGPTLSGKTLLLKLILRELYPTRGQILVAGRNILRLNSRKLAKLRERIGFVPYPPVILPNRTVEGNLRFKLRALGIKGEQAEEGVEKALSLTGLGPLKELRAYELGEAQRRVLAMAVAICNDPMVLLCDDPFRGLSPSDQATIMETLRSIRTGGIASLVTTDDPDLPRRSGFPDEAILSLRPGVVA